MTADLRVVPADEVPWADVRTVFATPGDPPGCWCQWFKVTQSAWEEGTPGEREEALRRQTCEGQGARPTTGLVAYLHDEPAGWVAVEPRTAYPRLRRSRVVWSGREEDKDDPGVWSVTCFVVREEHRGKGVARSLVDAAVAHARGAGAAAVEAYPQVVDEDERRPADDLYVGVLAHFLDAGFTEVSRPTERRAVVRLDL